MPRGTGAPQRYFLTYFTSVASATNAPYTFPAASAVIQMHDHQVARLDTRDDGGLCLRIPKENVTVADIGTAVDRDRYLSALRGRFAEPTLLRLPLIDLQQVYIGRRQPRSLIGVADVA